MRDMWRELIRTLTADQEPIGDLDPGSEFFPGATLNQLDMVERILGLRLPVQLREVLTESNGVCVTFGQHLLWNTDELVQYNRPPWVVPDDEQNAQSSQESYHLLFFGDAGVDGIRFGFLIMADGRAIEQIYAWYPIGLKQVWKASSLRGYIEGWLSGVMTV